MADRNKAVELSFRLGRDFEVPGIEPGDAAAPLVEAQVATTVQLLSEGDSLDRTIEVAEYAHSVHETLFAAWKKAEAQSLACRAGCAFCCSLNVTVTIPEAFGLLAEVRRRSAGEQTAVQRDAAGYASAVRNLSGAQRDWIRRPCPLLAGARCSVHSMRPLACRGWNSFDASRCERDSLHPQEDASVEIPAPPFVLARALALGISAGLGLFGLQSDFIHLPGALSIGLRQPLADLHRRWRRGIPVFADAVEGAQEPPS